MKIRDIIEIAQKNFRRLFKSNIGLIVIFTLIIVVFNITYTLTSAVAESASANITENQNLKIINVSTVEEEITGEEAKYISGISHVEMCVYDYCLSVAIEDDSGTDVAAIGMNDAQASYLVGESVSLKDDSIVLDLSFKEMGYKVGDTIEVSYNARVSDSAGLREIDTYTIVAFYEQPVVETWYDNVALVSPKSIFSMAAVLYGVEEKEIENGSLYKQNMLVFVDDVDNVTAVAEAIDAKGLMTSYALAYSHELPSFAKTIMWVGGTIIVVLLVMGIIVMNATLNKNIQGRYKEIGILKSMGMKEKHIFGILSMEVLMLWLLIALLATVMSFILAGLLNNSAGMPDMGEVNITFRQIMLSLIISYLVMFLTTVMTIKKAANLKTIEVLRNAQ